MYDDDLYDAVPSGFNNTGDCDGYDYDDRDYARLMELDAPKIAYCNQQTLIKKLTEFVETYDEEERERAKYFVDYVAYKFFGAKNPDDEVYEWDIVTLCIDGEYCEFKISPSLYLHDNSDLYASLSWDTNLATAIMGSYVGDTVEVEDVDGVSHTVQIVKTVRTKHSKKYNFDVAMADVSINTSYGRARSKELARKFNY